MRDVKNEREGLNKNGKNDMKDRSSEYRWWLPAHKIRVDVSLSS